MRPRYILTIAIVVLAGLFALLNRTTFLRISTLDFLITKVDAPFGVIMLCALGALALAYFIGVAQAGVRTGMQARNLYLELERSRQLAEKAEQLRFAELQAYLRREFAALETRLDAMDEVRGTQAADRG
jgi:hypothetical protein